MQQPKAPEENFVIEAIQQIDNGNISPKVDLIEGGVGSKSVTMTVSASKDTPIFSVFNFYGEKGKQWHNMEIYFNLLQKNEKYKCKTIIVQFYMKMIVLLSNLVLPTNKKNVHIY